MNFEIRILICVIIEDLVRVECWVNVLMGDKVFLRC